MSEPITIITSPVRLEYQYTPGVAMSRFLRQIEQGRIVGQRCPTCERVYVPPRSGACPRCGVPTGEEVAVADTGTVTTFCIVNVPFAGSIPTPYVAGAILLDGADIPLSYLIQEVDVDKVRMGMRVKAVWVEPEERRPHMESIRYFTPIDEPDVPVEQVLEALLNA
jgi:uncharacterized OB-fold protein